MTRLILVRAGQTDWQAHGRLVGGTDLHINETGHRQARAYAAVIADAHPEYIYCGEDDAARETAEIIGNELNLKVRALPAFHELDLGHWEGLTVEEFRERFPRIYKQWRNDPLAVEPPEGESVPTVLARMEKGLARVLKKTDGRLFVLVVGAFAHAALRCRLSGDAFDAFWDYVDAEDGSAERFDAEALEQTLTPPKKTER